MCRTANADASWAARRIVVGPMPMCRSCSDARRCGSWNGTRSPRRYGCQTGHVGRVDAVVRRRRRDQPVDPVQEQTAGVRRAADERLAGRGVGHGPQPVDLDPLRHDRPDDERGAEDHEHVAVVVGAGHELLAVGVDRAGTEQRAAGRVDLGRSPSWPELSAGRRAVSVRPASAATGASQPVKSNSGSVVMATTVSIVPSPHSAWLATAWAGQ